VRLLRPPYLKERTSSDDRERAPSANDGQKHFDTNPADADRRAQNRPTLCGILTEVTVALFHARSTDIRPARRGADFQFYCDVFSICNLQSVWFAGCLRWSTGLLLGCFPMAPPHARRLASGVDRKLCSFSFSLCRSSRTVTAKPCNTYYRFWGWCWLRSRMGLAFDLAHHLAQQTYLGRVASVSASGHFRKLGLVTERSGLPSIVLQNSFLSCAELGF